MPRKPRPLQRDPEVLRDASLIVIASEDRYAVESYFRRFRPKRVQFIVLPTLDCNSSPGHVLDRLNEFKQEYASESEDQFWLCIDADRWVEPNYIVDSPRS